MAGCPRNARRRPSAVACAALMLVAVAARAQPPADQLLDPLQQAVVESLSAAPRTTPAELLDAAIRAADVDATDAAGEWFIAFAAAVDALGDGKLDVLADLGDAIDPAALSRLGRVLAARDPAAAKAVDAIREASRLRRRDPKRLATAVEALASPSAATRLSAADELARAGVDALPVLVPLLSPGNPGVAAVSRQAPPFQVRSLPSGGLRVLATGSTLIFQMWEARWVSPTA